MENKFITLRNNFEINMGVRRAERNILEELIEISFFKLSQGHGSLNVSSYEFIIKIQ